jgi:uncharacterized radical SAM superfamily Fe-S cluster-containing enzyme
MERFSREDFDSKVDELNERFNSGEYFYVYDDSEEKLVIVIPNFLSEEEIETIKSTYTDVNDFILWEKLPENDS